MHVSLHKYSIYAIILSSVNGGYRFRKVKNLSAMHLAGVSKVNEVKSLSKYSADALSRN